MTTAASGRLADRSALITGGASGIGRATALRLAAEGACVVVADIDPAGLTAVLAELKAAGVQATSALADVGDEAAIENMVDVCVATFGGIDVLVNNAAAVGPDVLGRDRDVVNMPVELWDLTLRVDLRSQMLACRSAVPHMLRAGRGSIINVASVAGIAGDVVRAAYSAAKAGTIAMSEYIATMYGKDGIRCNAIAPGLVLSPAAEAGLPEATRSRLLDNHLTPRLGMPEDIAALIAFLACDDAAFVTGQVIRADGGALSHLPTYAQDLARTRDGLAAGR